MHSEIIGTFHLTYIGCSEGTLTVWRLPHSPHPRTAQGVWGHSGLWCCQGTLWRGWYTCPYMLNTHSCCNSIAVSFPNLWLWPCIYFWSQYLLALFCVVLQKSVLHILCYSDDSVSQILEEYNENHKPMNLVLFDDALEHLTRVHRVIRMDQGHALLVGVGGSGRQSVSRLAAFAAGYELFEITLSRVFSWASGTAYDVPPHGGRSDNSRNRSLSADSHSVYRSQQGKCSWKA